MLITIGFWDKIEVDYKVYLEVTPKR